jgi:hypothetical protein
MSDPGFVVTIRDVYDKVTALGESLDAVNRHLGSQSTEVALLKQRVGAVEDELKESRNDRRTRITTKWTSIVAVVAAFSSPVVALIVK